MSSFDMIYVEYIFELLDTLRLCFLKKALFVFLPIGLIVYYIEKVMM